MYGQEMGKMKKIYAYHGMLTDQNTSMGVELSDNSWMKLYKPQTKAEKKGWKEREEFQSKCMLDIILDHAKIIRESLGILPTDINEQIKQSYRKGYSPLQPWK